MNNLPKIDEHWRWKCDPHTELICVGQNGPWHQFEKATEPGKVWCEVLTADLRMLEPIATQPLKALSVRQPWAWLIVNGYKPVENRDWATKVRGRVLIHASKGMTRDEYEDTKAFVHDLVCWHGLPREAFERFPKFHDMQRGGIVGAVDIVDCVTAHPSRFFFGRFGFVLANPEVLPFQPVKGALGFFKPTIETKGNEPTH